MYAKTHTVVVTTDGDGDGTGYTPTVTGRVLQIRYVKTDYAANPDFDVTLETSGVVVWDEDDVDASKTICPRQAVHGTDGAAAEYAAGFPREEPIVVAAERIKIVVAGGGDTKTGTFHVTVG